MMLWICFYPVHAQEELGITYIDSLYGQLPEVMVKGERPIIKAEQGKLVYDLPRMLEHLSAKNAYEALKELSGIITDSEGKFSLGGRGLSIVINGKVSTLGTEQLKTLLESIPVDRLEKAEVMYAAPARYGIREAMINVILKSALGKEVSLSGELSGTYIKNRRETGKLQSVWLYSSPRFSLDIMYAFSSSRSVSQIEKTLWHTVGGQLHELFLNTRMNGKGKRHDYRLGADFDLGKDHRLSMVYNGNYRTGEDYTQMKGTVGSERTSDGYRALHNVKADYSSPVGFSAGMDFTFFTSPTDELLRNFMYEKEEAYTYQSNQRINSWLFYAHQAHILKNGLELNYGMRYKTTHDNSYQIYYTEMKKEMDGRFHKDLRKEYTLNLYTGASHRFNDKLSGEVSFAAELYHARERHNWELYPTMNLLYQPADGHIFQFSFTSDCMYPDYWHLQSLIQYVDSYTEVHGNPLLKPYSNYTFNLSYLLKNKYMISLLYQDSPGYFAQLPYQSPDRLAEINQFVNYDYHRNWMLQLMVSYRIANWWRGRIFAVGLLSADKLDNFHYLSFNRQKVTAIITTSNTFVLSKKPDIIATFSGRYQSEAVQGIYDIHPVSEADISLQWTSSNGKAKVILKGEDLLRRSAPHTTINWQGQRMKQKLDWDNRNVSLSFIYKIGGYKEKQHKEVDTSRLGR